MSSAGFEASPAEAEEILGKTTFLVRWVKGCSSSSGHYRCLESSGMNSCHNHQVLVEVKARPGNGFEADSENLKSGRRTGWHHDPDVTAGSGSLGVVTGSSPEGEHQLMKDEMIHLEDPKRGNSMTPYR